MQSINSRRSYCDINIWPNDLERHVEYCARLWDTFHQVSPSTTYPCLNYSVFTELHGMQTRSIDENSVRPSVRPSVCQSVRPSVTRVYCDKTVERSVQVYIPYERTFRLVFWEEEWLVEGDHFYLKFWVNRPPLEQNRRFSTNNHS